MSGRVDLARELEFDLGVLRVIPAERAVEVQGERRELQPRVMQVLVTLARSRPRVVSRDQFIMQCWNGRVVGDDALNRCILALRNLAKGYSPHPFKIETVPRVGHRLIENGVSDEAAVRRSRRLIVGAIGLVAVGGLGAGLAREIQRSRAPAPESIAAPPPAVEAETYRDYVSARGMLRTFNPQLGGMAVALLRKAVARSPDYAPAWSSLAEAIRLEASLGGHEQIVATLPEAQANARHAIALAPDLAEAHGRLGVLLGFDTREAQAHLRRAAALDPRSAEAQIWLAAAERLSGDFEGEIAAYRRAAKLDPDWYRPDRDLAFAVAAMGDRAGGERVARRAKSFEPAMSDGVMARIAWLYGDYAEAARRWSAVAGGQDSIWQAPARKALANAQFTLGLPGARPPPAPSPTAEMCANLGRFWMASAPSPEVWRQRNRNAAALVYREENQVGAKLMLAAGRGQELAAGYAGEAGLLGVRQGEAVAAKDLHAAPLVALALRQAGRSAEADALLVEAQAQVDLVYRRGRAPFTFDADAAAIAAVAGRPEAALVALRRAVGRGWNHSAPDDLIGLEDEPVFASLRGDPRFDAILAGFDARIARERATAIKLGL